MIEIIKKLVEKESFEQMIRMMLILKNTRDYVDYQMYNILKSDVLIKYIM